MPELPEVETVCRSLSPLLVGREITGVEVRHPGVLKGLSSEEFQDRVTKRRFQSINRRGKYLLFYLSGEQVMVVHLRMTGRLLLKEPVEPLDRHTHVIWELDAPPQLRFVDQRRFGVICLAGSKELAGISGIATMGPEPLDAKFSPEVLAGLLQGKKRSLKALLLDQQFIAGIGNIYADEILAAAGIHPEKPGGELESGQLLNLHQAIKEVLSQAVEHRGTTFRDYVDGFGRTGSHQEHLMVYQRQGQPCLRCGEPIAKTRVAGRGTCFCPRCQPLNRTR